MPTTNKEDKNQFEMLSVNEQIEAAMSEQNTKFDTLNSNVGELIINDESLNEYTKSQNDILLDISKNIGTTNTSSSSDKSFFGADDSVDNLVTETKKGHGILGDIKNLLSGKKGGGKDGDITGNKDTLIDDLSKDSNKGMLTNIIVLVGLLGGAFLILGKSLNLLGDIDYKKFLIITASLSLLFLTLSKILNTGVSFRDIIGFSLFAEVYANSVVDTLTKISDAPIPKEKQLGGIILISAFLLGSFAIINKTGVLSIGQALTFSLSSAILAESFVESSKILQKVQPIDNNKLINLGALIGLLVPVHLLMMKFEDKISIISSVAVSVFGFTLPVLAKSLVSTANIINQMPGDFNLKGAIMVGLLAIALFPFVTNTLKIFAAINPMMQQSWFDIAMRKLDYTKGAGVSFSAGNGVLGMNQSNIAVATRLGMSFAALPLLGITMVAVAGIFHLYQKAGGTFVTPPVSWSISVGLAIMAFSTGFSMIMFSIEPEYIRSIQKDISGKHGKSIVNENTITKSNVPGTLAVMTGLAVTMVLTALIFKLFPKDADKNMPSYNWSISVGIGMFLFAMALKRIVNAMQDTDGISIKGNGSKTGTAFSLSLPQVSGTLYMISMAASMVLVAKVLNYFPKNAFAPDLKWVLSVGLAMYVFTKSYSNITQVVKSNGGMFGSKEIETNSSNAYHGLVFMNLIAISMITVALILTAFPSNPKSPDIGWTISVGIAMLLFSKAISLIYNMTNKIDISGEGNTVNIDDKGGRKKGLFRTLMSISFSIVATAWIFQLLPDTYKSPDISWILTTGLALIAFVAPLVLLSKMVSSTKALDNDSVENLKDNKSKGILSKLIVIGFGVVAIAHIFRMLPDENDLNSPAVGWTVKTMAALIGFTGTMILLSSMLSKEIQNKTTGALRNEIIAMSISLLTIAWIFKLLPTTFDAPDIMWSIKTGISIIAFGAAIIALSTLGVTQQMITDGTKPLLTTALTIVTLAWIFQLLPDDQKAPNLIFTAYTVIALVGLAGAMALIGSWSENIKKSAGVIDNVLIGAIGIATIMYITGQSGTQMSDVAVFGAFIGLTIGIALVLGMLGETSTTITKGSEVLNAIAKPIAILSFAMLTWTYAVSLSPIGMVIGLAILTATIVVLSFIGYKLGDDKNHEQIKKGLLIMTLIALPIATLAIGMMLWTKYVITENTGDAFIALGLLVLTVTVMGLIGFVAGKKSKEIMQGSLALAVAALPIIVLAYGLKKWTETFPDVEKAKTSLMLLGLTIVGLATVMGLAGTPYTSPFIITGAFTMMFVGASLYVIGAGISKIMKAYDSESDLFTLTDEKFLGFRMTNFEIMMAGLARGFAVNPLTLTMMYLSIPAFMLAGSALYDIAKSLQQFSNLGIDTSKVTGQQIPAVLNALTDSFAEIGRKNKLGFVKGIFMKGDVAEGIHAIKGAGAVLSEITTGLVAFADMKFTDIDGKIVKLDNSKLTLIAYNIESVLDVLGEVFRKVGEKNRKKYGFNPKDNILKRGAKAIFKEMFTKGPVADGIKSVSGLGIVLSEIAVGLTSFANMKFTDSKGKTIELDNKTMKVVSSNIESVLTVVGKVFSDIGKNYNTGGVKGFFGENEVKDGINAISGAGTELNNIANSIGDFATLKFGDTVFKQEDLAYDPSKPMNQQGKIIQRIASVIGAVASVFSDIGKNHNKPGFWYDSNYVAIGVESVKGVGEEMVNIANSTKTLSSLLDIDTDKLKTLTIGVFDALTSGILKGSKVIGVYKGDLQANLPMIKELPEILISSVNSFKEIDKITQKQIDGYVKNIPLLFNLIPNTLIESAKILAKVEGGKTPAQTIQLINTNLFNTIDKMVKYKTPMESIASSFKSVSSSLTSINKSINTLDNVKMEKMNGMFNSIKNIIIPTVELDKKEKENGKGKVDNNIEKTANGIDKLSNKLNTALDTKNKVEKTPITEEAMKLMFDNLTKQIENLNYTMMTMVGAFRNEIIDVNVINKNVLGN